MAMKFKIDEDLPADVAGLLREAGHDAMTVNEQAMTGLPDDDLWRILVGEGRSLITADVGFADARRVAASPDIGIVLLRHPNESRRAFVELVRDLVAGFPLDQVAGCVVLVAPDMVRVHDTRRRGPGT